MTGREFVEWPKTPRLFRDMTITEKIDGTNAAVVITDDCDVYAQSRKRIITPDADNYGFARWVADRSDVLRDVLGVGRHFGEWWGAGIQRGYGGHPKTFSLFNTSRRAAADHYQEVCPGLSVVPVLREFTFSTSVVAEALDSLREHGSVAAPGYDRPEGVVVFHRASNAIYKALLEGDNLPKGLAA